MCSSQTVEILTSVRHSFSLKGFFFIEVPNAFSLLWDNSKAIRSQSIGTLIVVFKYYACNQSCNVIVIGRALNRRRKSPDRPFHWGFYVNKVKKCIYIYIPEAQYLSFFTYFNAGLWPLILNTHFLLHEAFSRDITNNGQ